MPSLKGNWSEEMLHQEDKMREWEERKAQGGLLCQQIGNKMKLHMAPFELQPPQEDGFLRFGDCVQLQNEETEGFLSVDLEDTEGVGKSKKFTCVTTAKAPKAQLRNTWIILRVKSEEDEYYESIGEGDVLHYNQKFSLCLNPNLSPDGVPLFLQTEPATATSYSKVSRKQEISLKQHGTFEFAWKCEYHDVEYRIEMEGQKIKANCKTLLRHCQTNQPLSSDKSKYVITDFANEYETCAHKWPTLQTKQAASQGSETPHNHWAFIMG